VHGVVFDIFSPDTAGGFDAPVTFGAVRSIP
jgi:hypothetical protein